MPFFHSFFEEEVCIVIGSTFFVNRFLRPLKFTFSPMKEPQKQGARRLEE